MSENSVAAVIARFLKMRNVTRVFGLCGGHIMPIWMRLDREGIRIIDVRDERAAVHMAHAEGELTGQIGVALITAGPGVTNGVTGIANAHAARAPVLVLSGVPPSFQEGRGALQDLPHVDLVRPITRYARTVREPALVLQELDRAVSHALGDFGDPGPVYLDFPINTLRAEMPAVLQLDEHLGARGTPRIFPDPAAVAEAVDVLWSARRPLVISGRGARTARQELANLLDCLGAAYLDTSESKGVISDRHSSHVGAARSAVLAEADVVLTVGRRLDFQLAFGSPALIPAERWVRIADVVSELRDNRRGTVEILASPAVALAALVGAAEGREPAVDSGWVAGMRKRHVEARAKLGRKMREAPAGRDGFMHPQRLLSALQDKLPPDAIAVADGGDFLSFARVALTSDIYLDPGPLGCLGVGVPFGIAASLVFPDRQVVVATGDGAFGFNAIEIDTAVRHKVPLVIVVANNGAWQIEAHDQMTTYGRVSGTRLQHADYAAMARAFGMYAERVTQIEVLPLALDRALAQQPSLLDVVVTTDAVSSDATSGLAIVPDLQALTTWDDAERRWRMRPV